MLIMYVMRGVWYNAIGIASHRLPSNMLINVFFYSFDFYKANVLPTFDSQSKEKNYPTVQLIQIKINILIYFSPRRLFGHIEWANKFIYLHGLHTCILV